MFPSTTKFLLVDDFASNRKVLAKSLAELGYSKIAEASDGSSALALLREAEALDEPFDMIISDSSMPGMSGLDLLKVCRADPKLAKVPFILVTAESDEKKILQAVKLGVSDYIVKPFPTGVLEAKLLRLYSRFARPRSA